MKHHITLLAAIAAFLLQAMPIAAQRDIPLHKIRAVKKGTDLTLLDSITGDSRRKIYQYNEYGYITSVMEYHKVDDAWTLNPDGSYRQEFVFNANGQCTSRTRYCVDEAGNNTYIDNKATLEEKDGLIWESYYERNFESDYRLLPSQVYAYDQWGNLAVNIDYNQDGSIRRYTKKEYRGAVDIYADHYKAKEIKERLLVSELNAYEDYDRPKTTNIEELRVTSFTKNEWTREGNKLYIRKYNISEDYGTDCLVKDVEERAELKSESVYTLNDAGTRPVSAAKRDLASNALTTDKVYTWDEKDRLTQATVLNSDTAYYITQYTYADDYAPEISLTQAIDYIDDFPYLYPEDQFQRFGHVSTRTQGLPNKDWDIRSEYSWNSEGLLTNIKETLSDESVYKTRVGYNSQGHIAWLIEEDIYNGQYRKIEYVYNQDGIYTDIIAYTGSDWDGPWHVRQPSNTDKQIRKAPTYIDDMSEGRHNIRYEDEVWVVAGFYDVGDGVVTRGIMYKTLRRTASIPQNPEYNYTDPIVPLEDDASPNYDDSPIQWYYEWDKDNNVWELLMGPEMGTHVYKKDGNIIAECYDNEGNMIDSTTYVMDSEGKLIEVVYSDGSNETYEYLADTNYLLESIWTRADESRDVCHYHYSKHNYVPPTGIDMVTSKENGHTTIYDLQGRRLTSPTTHGIYIINGKKVLR